MRAVVVPSPGDASNLSIQTVDTPKPAPHEVLVKVSSFAVNRLDILQRQGGYPAPFGASQILGVEFSGVVEEPDAGGDYKKGERVFALCYGGAYAEYVVVHKDMVIRIPDGMSFQEAAAIPEVWFTAYQALHLNCGLQEAESVLIHAGASGVGTSAIQLCKLTKAKHIIATVGSQEKAEFVKALGATHAVNYKKENFKEKVGALYGCFKSFFPLDNKMKKNLKQVLEYTSGRGVDVVVDFVGSTHWNSNLESLAVDGRMVMLAFLSGAVVSETNLAPILRKRLTIKGSTLRSREISYQIRLRNEVVEKVLPHLISGELKPIIDKTFSWKDIGDAHKYMEANATIGKIVVNVD
ncbi:hypothetical protein HDU67_008053 [Dinochytrium kinnereticum]|nr:hypothetical protein HDU67_008053 [Dinochytrium kinnereticum]